MKKYFKDNNKLFRFINSKKYKIIKIQPIRKIKRNGILIDTFISSYCVIYEKII